MMVFGGFGYLMRKLEFPVPPLVLAFILSRLVEESFRRSLIQGDGTLLIFVQRPIAAGFLLLTVLVLASLIMQQLRALGSSRPTLQAK
jgi:putative tricarboxylic transport membrane protein